MDDDDKFFFPLLATAIYLHCTAAASPILFRRWWRMCARIARCDHLVSYLFSAADVPTQSLMLTLAICDEIGERDINKLVVG